MADKLQRTMFDGPTPYDRLKALQQAIKVAGQRKTTIRNLLVLAPHNDPFRAGTEGDKQKAEWFAELWERFGYTTGVHLRRIHYRIVSEGNIRRFDGELYTNDKASWSKLNDASRQARCLGLVDPRDIVDRRNPTPHINLRNPVFGGVGEVDWHHTIDTARLGRIYPSLSNWRDLISVDTDVFGYEYDHILQPYHVEVWCEKTTMDNILVPLCRNGGVNYISGAGYQSITAMISLLHERVGRIRKPCRVLYISDYDDAGENMPRQMARQMQFWIDR